jgi:hypothetical protein
MVKKLVMSILTFFFLVCLVSAKISVSDPLEVYNLGDTIPLTVTLTPNSNEGWFTVDLICGGTTRTIEKILGKSFYTGEEQTRSLRLPLTEEYIGNITGECKIKSSINSEETFTPNFRISNKVNLEASIDKETYNPKETITLTVGAIKENGIVLNGFLETSGFASISKAIVDGEVVEKFSIPEKQAAGVYELTLFAYDKYNGQILNSNNKTLKLTVNQVPTFVDLSLSELEATPGQEYKFSLELLDQAGTRMEGAIEVTILSPKDEEQKLIVQSGETSSVNFQTNSTPGTYKISASFEELMIIKEFNVKEIQKVSLELVDSLLVVTNVGNTKYEQEIAVKIGDKTERFNLSIEVGEKRKFNLNAPDGNYDVDVQSGTDSIQKNLLLTGNAISIKNASGTNVFNKYPIIWVFLILLLAGTAFVFFKRTGKAYKLKEKFDFKKLFTFTRREKAPKKEKFIETTNEPHKKGNAESSLVIDGEREMASVIALKIKNMATLGTHAKEELVKILELAKDKKGMIEKKDDYLMIIFTPTVTKTYNNEMSATKVGFGLMTALNEYNKRFHAKLDYGIGVNSGELIVSTKTGKLQYTSLGSTVLLAKKIADSADAKLLVADSIRNKMLRDLRGEKMPAVGKSGVFSVTHVNDKEANKDKLQDLLNRMGHD